MYKTLLAYQVSTRYKYLIKFVFIFGFYLYLQIITNLLFLYKSRSCVSSVPYFRKQTADRNLGFGKARLYPILAIILFSATITMFMNLTLEHSTRNKSELNNIILLTYLIFIVDCTFIHINY